MRAYDAGTGALLWERYDDLVVGGIEVKGNSVVIAGAGLAFHVKVVEAATGLLRWEDLLVTPRAAGAGPIVCHGERLFVGGFRGNVEPPYGVTQYLLRAYDAR